jgi:hypothetical protein
MIPNERDRERAARLVRVLAYAEESPLIDRWKTDRGSDLGRQQAVNILAQALADERERATGDVPPSMKDLTEQLKFARGVIDRARQELG